MVLLKTVKNVSGYRLCTGRLNIICNTVSTVESEELGLNLINCVNFSTKKMSTTKTKMITIAVELARCKIIVNGGITEQVRAISCVCLHTLDSWKRKGIHEK